MKSFLSLLYIAAVVLGLCALAGPVVAQDLGPAAGNQVKLTPETQDKLNKMTPEHLAELDDRLAKALVLYYDRNYAEALPIFQQIAAEVQTTDIMFWMGNCAMRTGDPALAAQCYKKALEINPGLSRVRLELSAALMAQKQYDEAKAQAKRVLEVGPPDRVRDNIERMLAEMDQRDRRTYFSLRAWLGYLWDDNISFGPEDREYSVPGGSLRPGSETARQSGQGILASATGSILYDIGEQRGLMWNTELSGYNKSYIDKSEYNYMVFDLNTGPWWMADTYVARVPVGYTWRGYGNDRMSQTMHVDPSVFYRPNRYFSVQALYVYSRENFFASESSGLDNHNQRADLTARFYVFGDNHIIELTAGYEDHKADDGRFTYDGPYYAVGYRAILPWDSELYLRYHYNLRDYQDAELLYGYPRSDRRYSYTAVLSHNFTDNLSVSFNFNYVDVRSNIEIQTTDRTTFSVGVGYSF